MLSWRAYCKGMLTSLSAIKSVAPCGNPFGLIVNTLRPTVERGCRLCNSWGRDEIELVDSVGIVLLMRNYSVCVSVLEEGVCTRNSGAAPHIVRSRIYGLRRAHWRRTFE